MNNDSLFLVKIRLRADERDALMRLSRSERRDLRAQAAMLIREALCARELLTDAPTQAASFSVERQRADAARHDGGEDIATD